MAGTLADMKARIASELRRSNITTQIADAINTAIDQFNNERFWWNESRDHVFYTALNQEFYTATDSSWIGLITKIDYVILYVNTIPFKLLPMYPTDAETASRDGTFTGQPTNYQWYNNAIRLYPVPILVQKVRLAGTFTPAAPASDSEVNNPWMTTAELLVRCRAKYELALHVLKDPELAAAMAQATEEAFGQHTEKTTRLTKTGGGIIKPMVF